MKVWAVTCTYWLEGLETRVEVFKEKEKALKYFKDYIYIAFDNELKMQNKEVINKFLEVIFLNKWPIKIDWYDIIHFKDFLEMYNDHTKNFTQIVLHDLLIR